MNNFDTESIRRMKRNLGVEKEKVSHPTSIHERYKMGLRQFRLELIDKICELNGVNPNSIRTTCNIFGVISIKNTNGSFFKLSKLDWNNEGKPSKEDKKLRFLTCILISLGENIEIMVDKISDEDSKSKTYEFEFRKLQQIRAITNQLIEIMSTSDKYENIMLKFITYMIYAYDGVNFSKFNKQLIEVITDLETGLDENLMAKVTGVGIEIPNDLAIDAIIKTSYMMRTGNRNFKNLPSFDLIEGVTLDYDLSEIIGRLGKAVLKRDSDTMIYDAWAVANLTEKVGGSKEYVEGVLTLLFMKAIITNKHIGHFIDTMLET